MVDTSYIFSKPTECTTPRVNPNVNYGLRMLMMCQREFIDSNEHRALVGDVDASKVVHVCVEG